MKCLKWRLNKILKCKLIYFKKKIKIYRNNKTIKYIK